LSDRIEGKDDSVRDVVVKSIEDVLNKRTPIGSIECFACKVIYNIMHESNLDESTAANALSELLSSDLELNERFIEALEYVHLYSRSRALWFYSKSRDEKDNYLFIHVKNALAELEQESKAYGREYMLRRLMLSYLSSYIAQTIGLDLHASTEELYYLLRKMHELEHAIAGLLRD
jgi:hypothetical protein